MGGLAIWYTSVAYLKHEKVFSRGPYYAFHLPCNAVPLVLQKHQLPISKPPQKSQSVEALPLDDYKRVLMQANMPLYIIV